MRYTLFKGALGVAILVFLANSVPVFAATVRPFKNDLPRADWSKYGVNPWRLDTDNDGYSDAWEVSQGYCPTNPARGVALNDPACRKGTIDFAKQTYTPPAALVDVYPREMRNFSSCTELQAAEQNAAPRIIPLEATTPALVPGVPTFMETAQPMADFSSTNVQVPGVDEGDVVKTDGKNIFALSHNNLVIVQAAPADRAKLLSTTSLGSLRAQELYIDGSTLVVIGTRSSVVYPMLNEAAKSPAAIRPFANVTAVELWNISNLHYPRLVRTLEWEGFAVTSRVIDHYLYSVSESYVPYESGMLVSSAAPKVVEVPRFRDTRGAPAASLTVGFKNVASCAAVRYLAPIQAGGFLTIAAIPLANLRGPISQQVLWGSGQNAYVSEHSLYLTSVSREWLRPTVSDKTEIYKFDVHKGAIAFANSQTVPGTIVNRFALDENHSVLRVATTEHALNGGSGSTSNSLYFFDGDLNRIGWYRGIAPGESLNAARFLGDRAYLTTYNQVDPFFVFDISNPRSPQPLGQLQTSGIATYLQPYDSTHLIGVGYQTAGTASSTTITGLKMSLYDVGNPNQPVEQFTTTISGRISFSPVLYDPHALLFSKENNLLALPVSIERFADATSSVEMLQPFQYAFNGLYVYDVDTTNGFHFKGSVTHSLAGSDGVTWWSNDINRSLRIGNTLVALSPDDLSIHQLSDLTELKTIHLVAPSDTTATSLSGIATQ